MPRRVAFAFLIASGLLTLGATSRTAGAQESGGLAVGMRVRISAATTGERLEGVLATRTDDALGVRQCTDCDVSSVPVSMITRAEVSDGRARSWGRTLLGTLIGAVGGGVIGGAAGHSQEGACVDFCGLASAAGSVAGMAVGAVVGTVIGSQVKRETWHMVSLPQIVTRTSATSAVTPAAPRPTPPTRDPHTPGYVKATELPDGSVPPVDAEGNYIIGPTHAPAPETIVRDDVPHGTIYTFTMSSADSRIYPGIARDAGTFGTPDPADPTSLIVTTSRPAPYTRRVSVYVPAQYVPGTAAPFIVGADGPDPMLFTALDNLIAQKRVPVMIAISIGNGSGDAQGSQRGLEYDTMSGRYAEFVETEVLPIVEQHHGVKLTRDPDGRATMGGSSGGSAAFIMAWYRPDLYRRVLAYSITAVNQQWPHSAETPHGAWEFHERIIPNSPVKPVRVWLAVGDRDLLNPNVMRDEMHDWVLASENMAKVLAAKGYHYQFSFVRNAGHTDRAMKQQTLPQALEWLWRGYRPGP